MTNKEETDAKKREAVKGTPTMIYKYPGPHKIHKDSFDFRIIPASEVDEALKEGWCLTTPEAKQKAIDGKKAEIAETKEKLKAVTKTAKKRPGRPKKKVPDVVD